MRSFRTAAGELPLGQKAYLMGILNVTPDSFSDGGLFSSAAAALRHAEEMAAQGADLIDVGAVSTSPFASPVSEEEEWERLSAVLPTLLRETALPVSVDTTSLAVARRCLDLGVAVINDYEMPSSTIAAGLETYPEGCLEAMQANFTCFSLDAASIAQRLGSAKCMNVVLFGAMTKVLELEGIDWETIIRSIVPEKFVDLNLAAYHAGREAI